MLLLLLLGCPQAPPAVAKAPSSKPLPEVFWATWGDGKAEVARYALQQPRYGAIREGTATLITVTEDFSFTARIKADPGAHPADDLRPVLKLNAEREFRTGVYPYHVLTSVFLRVEPGDGMARWHPLKVTTSVAEWCGHAFERWIPQQGAMRLSRETYFDSDDDVGANGGAPTELKVPDGAIFGDALPLIVRQLDGPLLAVGESLSAPYVPRQMDLRFAHTDAKVGQINVRRGPDGRHDNPLGSFVSQQFVAEIVGGDTFTFTVEADYPHRLLAWSSTSGESGVITKLERIPYWAMNGPDQAAF